MSARRPKTIHDFGGFPRALYQQQYPAPGAPAVAQATIELVRSTHLQPDEEWGLDHGAWSVLMRMFPDADVPVFQLSLDLGKAPAAHLDLARELKPLRERGVLIIGSGNLVHNLGALNPGGAPYDWAQAFDETMKARIAARDARRRRRGAERLAHGAARPSDARAFPAGALSARRRRREGRIELLQRILRPRLDLDALLPAVVRALVAGAGPAGLMAAEILARAGVQVEVADAAASPLRKFLLAGRGGLNLTNAEPLERFLTRYGAAQERLAPALERLPARGVARLGGRSRRADLRRLQRAGVSAKLQGDETGAGVAEAARRTRRRLSAAPAVHGARRGRRDASPAPTGEERLSADVVVLAFGGASWPRLGGDGGWVGAAARAPASRSRRWRRPIWACMSIGRRLSRRASPASR